MGENPHSDGLKPIMPKSSKNPFISRLKTRDYQFSYCFGKQPTLLSLQRYVGHDKKSILYNKYTILRVLDEHTI